MKMFQEIALAALESAGLFDSGLLMRDKVSQRLTRFFFPAAIFYLLWQYLFGRDLFILNPYNNYINIVN